MYAIFLLTMFFTTEASDFTLQQLRHGFDTSIEQFYNTSEPIWTTFTRADASFNLSCIVDVTFNTTLSNLYFERSYYWNQTRVKIPLRRALNKRGTDRSSRTLVYDARRPIYEPQQPLFEEELLYQSDDSSCGVFRYFKHPDEPGAPAAGYWTFSFSSSVRTSSFVPQDPCVARDISPFAVEALQLLGMTSG
uniref:Putative lipocalin-3 1 n=1 Tax=Amblyomma cajennense TaxID=34607 RepID=A0A023FC44_AMBCJ